MALIQKDYKVIYDSRLDNTFRVWNEGKTKYQAFRKYKRGLYNTYMSNRVTVMTQATVKENKSNDPDRERNRARVASTLQDNTGNINAKDLLYIINKRLTPKLPITCDDLNAASDILGTSIKALKVNTVRKSGYHVQLEI